MQVADRTPVAYASGVDGRVSFAQRPKDPATTASKPKSLITMLLDTNSVASCASTQQQQQQRVRFALSSVQFRRNR